MPKVLNLSKCHTDKDGKFIEGGEIYTYTDKEFERVKKTMNFKDYFLEIEE